MFALAMVFGAWIEMSQTFMRMYRKGHLRVGNATQDGRLVGPCLEDFKSPRTKDGYPHTWRDGRSRQTARHVLTELDPRHDVSDLQVHHRCNNPLCINPFHLQWVTKEEHRRLHAKLTNADRAEIVRQVQAGEKQKDVADRWNISQGYVSRLCAHEEEER